MARSSNVVIEQVLNRVLSSSDISLFERYGMNEDYFPGYEEEYWFIKDHYDKYHTMVDKITFLDEFPDFNIFSVTEPDEYLYKQLFELHYYNYIAENWEAIRDEIVDNPIRAMERFQQAISNAPSQLSDQGVDIIKDALSRLKSIEERNNKERPYFIKTGFDELDGVLDGWARGEELVVIFGRTGQSKSWVTLKSLVAAYKQGNRVGFISPEMTGEKVGFRFDTLHAGFLNRELTSGRIEQNDLEFKKYKDYLEELSTEDNVFMVAGMLDFQKQITVGKLRTFVQRNRLDILAIDGITYMSDERRRRGDNKTTTLTNISEDLMTLSNELHIPIIVVVQANRGGVVQKGEEANNDTPELESIRDSDGISHNATKIISIKQTEDKLDLSIKKNRDGKTGDTFSYYWDPNSGALEFYEVERDRNSYGSNDDKPTSHSRNKKIEEYDEVKPTRKKKVREF